MCVCGQPDCTVPYGKCHCGCGADAVVPKRSRPTIGHVAGVPREFARGHWMERGIRYQVSEDGCWVWRGAIDPVTGYGKKGKGYAHRASYEAHIGAIPDGMELDHLCRNRACVNPDHLEPVNHVANARRGAQTKLTALQVAEIRRLRRSGVPNKDVASMFGISRQNVSNITARRSWQEVN